MCGKPHNNAALGVGHPRTASPLVQHVRPNCNRQGKSTIGGWVGLLGSGKIVFPETLKILVVSGNIIRMPEPASENSAATNRVRQHRATAGMIRVEVEVPTREDALTVRQFAQGRRRSKNKMLQPIADTRATTTSDDLIAILADMDATRQATALVFGQALAQTTDPDMLERGRRVALNFADAVTQRRRDMMPRDDNGGPVVRMDVG